MPESPKEKRKLEIVHGGGTRLGDIPNVAHLVGKFKRKDEFLKKVHALLFRKPGAYLTVKKNILEFSGKTALYSNPESGEKERQKDATKLDSFKVKELDLVLDTFDLPRGKGEQAKKEGKVARILDFVMKPSAREGARDLAGAEEKKKLQRKRKAERGKRKRTAAAGAARGKKRAAGPKAAGPKVSKAQFTSLGSDSDSDSGSGSDYESDSEDDTPLVPAKKEVTEAALRQEIVPILRQVDLTAFSLKNLMARLSEEFGGADLKPHKPFIKEEVQRALADIQQGL